jgi:hypothetical protein
MKTILKLSLVAAIALSAPQARASSAVSTDDVLAMAALLPQEGRIKPAGYEKSGDARAIAAGIASVSGSREEAAMLLTYAAYESSLTIGAVGDGGKSLGPWQLRYVGSEVAQDPARAAHYWLWLAGETRKLCAQNAPDEQLAALASGSCARARAKVRKRAETARAIAAAR